MGKHYAGERGGVKAIKILRIQVRNRGGKIEEEERRIILSGRGE